MVMSEPEHDHARLRRIRRMTLASRLRQLRAARGLSQEQLADRAGIDRSNYSRVESGKVSPSADLLFDIAAALHVHISEVFRDPP